MPQRKTPLLRSPSLWAVLIAMTISLACALFWVFAPMAQREAVVDLSIEPGTSVRGVAEAVLASGVDVSPQAFWLLLRLSGKSRQLRAGSYEVTLGTSPWQLMQKLVRGDQSLRTLTVVEGWTLAQMRKWVDQAEGLRHDTLGLSDADLMARLGRAGLSAEGRFFSGHLHLRKGHARLAHL